MSSQATRPVLDFVSRSLSSGVLVAGQRLPTERELAMQFRVSRTIVRQALTVLEAEQRIVRHVGRGTFVANGSAPAVPEERGGRIDASPSMLIEARCALESMLAEIAVLNATEADLAGIGAACEALGEAESPLAFERADAAFHRAIAEATHNGLLIAAYDLIASGRQGSEWRKLKQKRHAARPERRPEVMHEHRAILAALTERDADAARLAMLDHLQRVRANLLSY